MTHFDLYLQALIKVLYGIIGFGSIVLAVIFIVLQIRLSGQEREDNG